MVVAIIFCPYFRLFFFSFRIDFIIAFCSGFVKYFSEMFSGFFLINILYRYFYIDIIFIAVDKIACVILLRFR
nr:MAG TPA: hypothetical protein [Caudoviricetes sp.]